MGKFQEATQTQAYVKAGFLGFAGAGKTYTAYHFARGLIAHVDKGSKKKTPLFFLDTEQGSDWFVERAKQDKIKYYVQKTRAFKELIPALEEARKEGAVLIADSLTHFWRELCETFMRSKRINKLEFHHYNILKPMWHDFSDRFVMDPVHVLVCGRAGFEWDFEMIGGKKELVKTDVKMKAEGEFGYEPNLLIEMERVHAPGLSDDDKRKARRKTHHLARVLKDRSDTIQSHEFVYDKTPAKNQNPVWRDLSPHVLHVNIGGEQGGQQDMRERSDIMFADEQGRAAEYYAKKKAYEEIIELLGERINPHKAQEKAFGAKLKFAVFNTRSWSAIKEMSSAALENKLAELNGFFGYMDSLEPEQREAAAADVGGIVSSLAAGKLVKMVTPDVPPEEEDHGAVTDDDMPW